MIGLWRLKNEKGFMSHAGGLNQEQIDYLRNLKVGDKLIVFENTHKEGERGPALTLKRSLVPVTNTK